MLAVHRHHPLSCSYPYIYANKARETKHVGLLSLDEALVVPAMTHCRTMCEHDFLSHWDIAGRKPYQRYSDFAYGQHVSEAVFGFDVNEATDDEVCKMHVIHIQAIESVVYFGFRPPSTLSYNCCTP